MNAAANTEHRVSAGPLFRSCASSGSEVRTYASLSAFGAFRSYSSASPVGSARAAPLGAVRLAVPFT